MKGSTKTRIAIVIEAAIILTSVPRWVPALMQAEGYTIPVEWSSWWLPMSAAFNAGMGVTEAVAIAYVFAVWSRSSGVEARRLLILCILMLATFSIVITPFVSANIAGVPMNMMISNPGQYWLTLVWGLAITLSVGFTAMAVGMAQGVDTDNEKQQIKNTCWCGYVGNGEKDLYDHQMVHYEEVQKYENLSASEAREKMVEKYQDNRTSVLPDPPSILEVAKMRQELMEG